MAKRPLPVNASSGKGAYDRLQTFSINRRFQIACHSTKATAAEAPRQFPAAIPNFTVATPSMPRLTIPSGD